MQQQKYRRRAAGPQAKAPTAGIAAGAWLAENRRLCLFQSVYICSNLAISVFLCFLSYLYLFISLLFIAGHKARRRQFRGLTRRLRSAVAAGVPLAMAVGQTTLAQKLHYLLLVGVGSVR